jgi:hypothetical protein
MPAQTLDCPRQRRRRGLVARRQKCQQLVGDVLVGDRRAVLIARSQHEGEHVVALFDRRIVACLGDEIGDDLVVPSAVLLNTSPRTP